MSNAWNLLLPVGTVSIILRNHFSSHFDHQHIPGLASKAFLFKRPGHVRRTKIYDGSRCDNTNYVDIIIWLLKRLTAAVTKENDVLFVYWPT